MLSSLNTYYISMAAMLGKFEIKMGAVFKNLSEIVFTELCAMKPKKSSYKFINSYLTEFTSTMNLNGISKIIKMEF